MALRCRGLRRCGAAALDLAWVAAGRFEGFWEYRLKPWDLAAGALLVQEAGGIVTDCVFQSIDRCVTSSPLDCSRARIRP